MKKVISLLGSTGSIGLQTLDVARLHGIKIAALAAHSNIELLYLQALEFRPELVAVYDTAGAAQLRARLAPEGISVVAGEEGLCRAATVASAESVLTAVVGTVGLLPTLEAIKSGKEIALANKETLVAAGELVMRSAREKGVKILPVDSEHSAIFQSLLSGNAPRELRKIILTASGGPFYGKKRSELLHIKPSDAVSHPNWNMGRKISVDSATLMNKGLEFIEAMHLFSVTPDQIEVVVQRESIIHSAVEFVDGSVMAQLSSPDMRLPIQLALTYPERFQSSIEPLDLFKIGKLTFAKPDCETFRALPLCMAAARVGGTLPAALNGANEAAVALFLDEKISFLAIDELLTSFVSQYKVKPAATLSEVLAADRAGREFIADKARGIELN